MSEAKTEHSKKSLSKGFSIAIILVLLGIGGGLLYGNLYALSYSPIISTYFGHRTFKVVEKEGTVEDTAYFKPAFSSEAQRLEAASAAGREAAAEGIVLLRNEESVLPLSEGSRITLLGVGSAAILYGGGGSGAVDTSSVPTMKLALESRGFSVNPVLWDFYTAGAAKDIRMDIPDIAGTGRYVIHEAHPSLLDEKEKSSLKEYGDAALVVVSRSGGESSDLPGEYDETYLEVMDVESYAGKFHSEPLDSPLDVGRHYLELTYNEEEILRFAKENFDKVILIINTANPIDLGFMEDASFGVDAALWIGNPVQDGLFALADIIEGSVNPSGRLVDTFAYCQTGSPAYVNFGNNTVSLSGDRSAHYVVYQEGIYVGYRYYETRYEDTVLSRGNAVSAKGVTAEGEEHWDYDKEVLFPFGYGLSYTTFSQKLLQHSKDDASFTFSVEVTNTGERAGKEVVQLYMQAPYTDYGKEVGIERPAVQLVGFAKTKELAPGEKEVLSIQVEKELLKVYDVTAKKDSGQYILEEGIYYFAVASDAHDAVKHILAKKGVSFIPETADASLVAEEEVKGDFEGFAHSPVTGEVVENRFRSADIRAYDSNFVYLSRKDWEGTYPSRYHLQMSEKMEASFAPLEVMEDPDASMPVTNRPGGLTLAMMREVDYEDPLWESFMDQLSKEEMYNLVRIGGYQTQALPSVGVPATVHVDGPAYVGVAGLTGVMTKEKTYAWSSEVLLASTWNEDILYKMGSMIGEDALAQGDLNFAGWYAPAMNIHRTAFSGRNFEYYSEDSLLSAKMGAATVRGAAEKGLITFIKHFALNDQETGRAGLITFANEQSIREIYLKAFEDSITKGGALGVMSGMNRVGLSWAGDHAGLMTDVLRKEWGFRGIAVTDQASFPQAFPFMTIRGGLEGGMDLYLNTGTENWLIEGYQDNATVMTQLRRASKNILYSVSRSLAMNGISSTAQVEKITPLWQTWMFLADVMIFVICLLVLLQVIKRTDWKKK